MLRCRNTAASCTIWPAQDVFLEGCLNLLVQWTWISALVLSLVFCVLWPVLTIPAGVFSKPYYTFWVILSIIWGLVAAVIAIFMPLWESRDVFARCAHALQLLKILLDCHSESMHAAFISY